MQKEVRLFRADEVMPHVMRLLELAPRMAVVTLRRACAEGQVLNTNCHDQTVSAVLTQASGRNIRGESHEVVQKQILEFYMKIGYEPISVDGVDPIEQFFGLVRRGHTHETNDTLAHLILWCDLALQRKLIARSGTTLFREQIPAVRMEYKPSPELLGGSQFDPHAGGMEVVAE